MKSVSFQDAAQASFFLSNFALGWRGGSGMCRASVGYFHLPLWALKLCEHLHRGLWPQGLSGSACQSSWASTCPSYHFSGWAALLNLAAGSPWREDLVRCACWCLVTGGWLKMMECSERVVRYNGMQFGLPDWALSSLQSPCALNASWAWREVEIPCKICYVV